ncbi:MAG: hypothetical protein DHS20C19_19770 [Acidimicrobiales bacterium]|nr:MAG: hypothetical protein DHS20C19_19770 [Acidimicrobiales bacterium]
MRPVRSLLVLSRLTQAFVGVQIVIAAFSSHALWSRADTLTAFNDRLGVGERHLDSADTRVLVTSLLFSMTYLIAAVTFLVWFHAAYQNLERRGVAKHTSGWAIGAWFVPVLGMWRPVKIAEELLGPDSGPQDKALLWTWWILWVPSMLIWSVAFVILPDDIDDLIALDSWSAVGRAGHVAAGAILVVLVRRVLRADAAAAPAT